MNLNQTITQYEILVQEDGEVCPLLKDVVIFKYKAKRTAKRMRTKNNKVFLVEVVSRRKQIKF